MAVIGWQGQLVGTSEVGKEKWDWKAWCGSWPWWEKTKCQTSSYLIPESLRETKALPMPPGAVGQRLKSWTDLSTPVLSKGSCEYQAKTGVINKLVLHEEYRLVLISTG